VAKLPKLLRVVDSGEQQKRCELSGLSDGSTDTRGYRYLTVDGRGYLSSRFAYLYMTGVWPENQIVLVGGNGLSAVALDAALAVTCVQVGYFAGMLITGASAPARITS
jgi:hypothetical protein